MTTTNKSGRRYDREFKENAVALVRDGRSQSEVAREEAELTLALPDRMVPGRSPRVIYQRRYDDALLDEPMLLRLVVEETDVELVVVTV